MIQHSILNMKFSNSQLKKLKSGIKNDTEVTLNLWSNAIAILMMIIIFQISYY